MHARRQFTQAIGAFLIGAAVYGCAGNSPVQPLPPPKPAPAAAATAETGPQYTRAITDVLGQVSPYPVQQPTYSPAMGPTKVATRTQGIAGRVNIAVIGDLQGPENSEGVRKMVEGWQPDYVISLGDYTLKPYPYQAFLDQGMFLKVRGNHDQNPDTLLRALRVIMKPGIECGNCQVKGTAASFPQDYYSITMGNGDSHDITFIMLDTNWDAPNGFGTESSQMKFLAGQLKGPGQKWILAHVPPGGLYTSSVHPVPEAYLGGLLPQFSGAAVFIGGHQHVIVADKLPNFTVISPGSAGGPTYSCNPKDKLDLCIRGYGALKITIDPVRALLQIYQLGENNPVYDISIPR